MAKPDGYRIHKHFFMYSVRKKRKECSNVGGVTIGSTNGVVRLKRDAWSTVR